MPTELETMKHAKEYIDKLANGIDPLAISLCLTAILSITSSCHDAFSTFREYLKGD